jgi:hypothetical protein
MKVFQRAIRVIGFSSIIIVHKGVTKSIILCEAWSSSAGPPSQSISAAAAAASATTVSASRRQALGWIVAAGVSTAAATATAAGGGSRGIALASTDATSPAAAGPATAAQLGGFDIDDYLRTGLVAQPMGVSGQAGKSRPETGVVLRDGSEISRNARTGDVSAEILLKSSTSSSSSNEDKVAVLTLFSSPWPLATGSVFDVECRDAARKVSGVIG